MKKGNAVKKSFVYSLALGGRGLGEGVLNKETALNSPSSVRWTPSPSSGEGRGGFTLIELLVVVLIIGILAAVALPQYQKAVEKARLSALFPTIEMLANAQKRYYLENDKYATSFEELDLSFPGWEKKFKHTIGGMTGKTALYNGNDVAIYIGYRDNLNCNFAFITRGKYYPDGNYGYGLGYCFGGKWYFPVYQVFCQEGENAELKKHKGEFCKLMGFNNHYKHGWGDYYTK